MLYMEMDDQNCKDNSSPGWGLIYLEYHQFHGLCIMSQKNEKGVSPKQLMTENLRLDLIKTNKRIIMQ